MKTIKQRADDAWFGYEYKNVPNLYRSCFIDGFVTGAKQERERIVNRVCEFLNENYIECKSALLTYITGAE